MAEIVPVDKDYRLERYCSYWYNVSDDQLVQLGPVPSTPAIINSFRAKFPPNGAHHEAPASTAQGGPQLRRPGKRVV